MARKKVINPNISNDLQSDVFKNVSSSLVTQIADFNITSNFEATPFRDIDAEIETSSKAYTLDTIVKDYNQIDLTQATKFANTLKINFDKADLTSYSHYGSMSELLRVTIEQIVLKYPHGIFVDTTIPNLPSFSVASYTYDIRKNESTFVSNVINFSNPSTIIYVSGNVTDELTNLNSDYRDFVIHTIADSVDYDIVGFSGSTNITSGFVRMTVKGNPFPQAINSNKYIDFFIRPKKIKYEGFIKNLSELEGYILGNLTDEGYKFVVKKPVQNDRDFRFEDLELTWNLIDGYNLDTISNQFQIMVDTLATIGEDYDNLKTDLIYRMLVPSSIIELDATTEGKMQMLLRVYGREYDEIKRFVDSLVYINNVSYDKKKNIPDLLISNLAKTLGWDYFDIVGEDDIFKNFFNANYEDTVTPAEINIELWRRIIINTNYFWKTKGTRNAIIALFELVGIPEMLIDINEHVYLVDGKLPTDADTGEVIELEGTTDDIIDLNSFVNKKGYPTMPINTIAYFQSNGNSDSGNYFIDYYRQAGFTVKKVIDNKKTWSNTELIRFDELSNTNYTITDSNLVLNTKEISITLNPAKLLEFDVYNFNYTNNYPIALSGNPKYPNLESTKFDVSELSFVEYLQKVYERFIDVKNRKILYEYPTLKQLFKDYLNDNASKKYQYKYILNYTDIISTYWNKFIKQLIPATTIVTEQGMSIKNTIFDTIKHPYKRGVNDGSEFQIKQPEEVVIPINVLEMTATKSDVYSSSINTYQLGGTYQSSFLSDFNYKQELDIRADVNFDVYEYEFPKITNTNLCKIDNNVEVGCIHIKNVDFTGKTVDFTITGNTGDIVFFDGFLYDNTISGFTDTKQFTYSVTLTALTYNYSFTILNNILLDDKEYLVKPYIRTNITIGNDLTLTDNSLDYYGRFNTTIYPTRYFDSPVFFNNNNIGISNILINTEDTSITKPYRKYDVDNDFYFVSLGSPYQPSLVSQTNNGTLNQFLVVENLDIVFSAQTQVFLTQIPYGDVELAFDGTVLTKNIDYSASTNNTIYDLLFTVDNNTPHYIQATYLAGNGNLNIYKEINTIAGITSGTTNNNTSKMFYNSGSSYYEYSTDFVINNLTNFRMIYNGTILINGIDFTLSSTNDKVIILLFTVNINDTFMLFYENRTVDVDIENLNTNPFDIVWNMPVATTNDDSGYFVVQIATYPDISFSGVIDEFQTDYIIGATSYSFRPPTVITPANSVKVIRVINVKTFLTIGGDIVESYQYSNNKLVKLPL